MRVAVAARGAQIPDMPSPGAPSAAGLSTASARRIACEPAHRQRPDGVQPGARREHPVGDQPTSAITIEHGGHRATIATARWAKPGPAAATASAGSPSLAVDSVELGTDETEKLRSETGLSGTSGSRRSRCHAGPACSPHRRPPHEMIPVISHRSRQWRSWSSRSPGGMPTVRRPASGRWPASRAAAQPPGQHNPTGCAARPRRRGTARSARRARRPGSTGAAPSSRWAAELLLARGSRRAGHGQFAGALVADRTRRCAVTRPHRASTSCRGGRPDHSSRPAAARRRRRRRPGRGRWQRAPAQEPRRYAEGLGDGPACFVEERLWRRGHVDDSHRPAMSLPRRGGRDQDHEEADGTARRAPATAARRGNRFDLLP